MAGTLKRPRIAELFTPQLRRTTIVTTAMMACAFAVGFGTIQQAPRIVPGLAEVQTLDRTQVEQTVSGIGTFQEIGGLSGRLLLATLAAIIIGRRRLLWLFQIPGAALIPIFFFLMPVMGLGWAQFGVFICGLVTIAQFSFWGNYLPRVFPTHLRGTGESFATNVGGRMIGTSGAIIATSLVAYMPGDSVPFRLAYAAATVGTVAYIIGFIISFWLPEPKGQALPD